jgi:acetyl-CoA carboxylase biotin carboxyl carrier protein
MRRLLGKDLPMGHKENEFDLSRIEKILEIMKANDLVEIEIKQGDDKIFLKRSQPQFPGLRPPDRDAVERSRKRIEAIEAVPVPAGQAQAGGTDAGLEIIKSPIVGTFYAAPSPDSPPFVEAGSKVEPQMVVCIIEAMKVMNEIKTEKSGTIVEVMVKNGQALEFGQPLFKLKPD